MDKFYNSGVPQFLPKVKTYCAKVLPMVFDNSISYYETVCHLIHKVNECIEALNAQNLNIIEFTHMVSVEIEKFEKFIDNYIKDLESTFRKEWEEFKTELNTDWEEYKTFLTSEWENEKKENEAFRNKLQGEWLSFKDELNLLHDNFIIEIRNKIQEHVDDINSKLEEYENTYNTDFNNLRENLQHQNDEFEDHMIELFNTFKETEKASRTEFESNFQQLFEQWKTNTLNAITEQINHEHTEMYDSLKNWIEVQINLAKDAMKNDLNNTERKLTQEIESRISSDNNLQTQINQLTPEGSIKYEKIENSELHQLYGIENNERVNIYPNTLQGGCYLHALKSEISDNLTSYLKKVMEVKGTTIFEFADKNGSAWVNSNGITDLGCVMSFPLTSLINYDDYSHIWTGNIYQILAHFHFNVTYYCDADYLNKVLKAKPFLHFDWARVENGYLNIAATMICSDSTAATNEKINLTSARLIINHYEIVNNLEIYNN